MTDRVAQFTTAQTNAHIKYERNVKSYVDKVATYGPILICVKAGEILQYQTTVSNTYVIVNTANIKETLLDICNYSIMAQLQIKNVIIDNTSYQHIATKAKELFMKKNADYGDAFATYGIVGVLVRMGDKIARLKTFTKVSEFKVKDESVLDTLIDLYNYSVMAMILINDDECSTNLNRMSTEELHTYLNTKQNMCNIVSDQLRYESHCCHAVRDKIQSRCEHKWEIAIGEFTSDRTPHICTNCGMHD